jgi:hypothetical protein
MESQGSLPRPQEPATSSYFESHKSNPPLPPYCLFKTYFDMVTCLLKAGIVKQPLLGNGCVNTSIVMQREP